jgi:hypothetical protein
MHLKKAYCGMIRARQLRTPYTSRLTRYCSKETSPEEEKKKNVFGKLWSNLKRVKQAFLNDVPYPHAKSKDESDLTDIAKNTIEDAYCASGRPTYDVKSERHREMTTEPTSAMGWPSIQHEDIKHDIHGDMATSGLPKDPLPSVSHSKPNDHHLKHPGEPEKKQKFVTSSISHCDHTVKQSVDLGTRSICFSAVSRTKKVFEAPKVNAMQPTKLEVIPMLNDCDANKNQKVPTPISGRDFEAVYSSIPSREEIIAELKGGSSRYKSMMYRTVFNVQKIKIETSMTPLRS